MAHAGIMDSLGELDNRIDQRIIRERQYILNIKTGLLVIINRLQECAEDAVDNGADAEETGEIMDALRVAKNKLQSTPPFQEGNVQNEVDSIINPLQAHANNGLRKVPGSNPNNDETLGWNVDPGDLPPDLNEGDLSGGWKTKSKRRSRRSNRSNRTKRRSKR